MNRTIGAAVQDGFLDLLDEQPLATDFAERPIDDPVTGRHYV
jgi:hypothetical protein